MTEAGHATARGRRAAHHLGWGCSSSRLRPRPLQLSRGLGPPRAATVDTGILSHPPQSKPSVGTQKHPAGGLEWPP